MFEYEWDVFISHASEDKESVARPLANHLAGFGLKVWLDESELHLGDSLREKIDAGLAQSRFGLVILSPDFFAKIWTKSELDDLVAKEVDGIKVILPIWHKLGHDEIRQRSPILAGRLAASTNEGLDTVATKIIRAIESSGSIKRHVDPLFEGRLTKKKLLSLPEGSFLLSNRTKPDLTPALAEAIPKHHLRESFWEKLTRDGASKTKFYVFEDAASYRAHMASRNIYVIEEAERVRNRRARKAPLPDFDIRAHVAAGKSPTEARRPLITSLSFDDDKYKFAVQLESEKWVCGIYEYPPLSSTHDESEDESFSGPLFELAKLVFVEIGKSAFYKEFYFTDLYGAESAREDMVVGMFETPGRRKEMLFSRPFYEIGLQGICRIDLQGDILAGLRDGPLKGAVHYGEVGWEFARDELPDAVREGRINILQGKKQMDTMSLLRLYDVVLMDHLSCENFLKKDRNRKRFRCAFDEPLKKYSVCIAIRHAHSSKLEKINVAVARIRNTRRFLEIENAALRGYEKVVAKRGLRAVQAGAQIQK